MFLKHNYGILVPPWQHQQPLCVIEEIFCLKTLPIWRFFPSRIFFGKRQTISCSGILEFLWMKKNSVLFKPWYFDLILIKIWTLYIIPYQFLICYVFCQSFRRSNKNSLFRFFQNIARLGNTGALLQKMRFWSKQNKNVLKQKLFITFLLIHIYLQSGDSLVVDLK